MKNQIINNYLDGTLQGEERTRAEKMIKKDPELKKQFEAMKLSVDVIRQFGLSQEIAAIQKEYLASKNIETVKQRKAIVRPMMMPSALRIAATVLLIVGAFSIFKYSLTSSEDVYSNYYMPYEVSRVRSSEATDAMEKAFINKDWSSVIRNFSGVSNPGNKELFLSGVAFLESYRSTEAIKNFEKIININNKIKSDYFNDEAEYYLALSYIRNRQAKKAVPLLKKIRENKEHLYHKKALDESLWDVEVLRIKQ